MAYPVDSSDVEARWRPLDDAERAVADTLLGDATELLDNLRPTLAAQYAAEKVPLGLIRQVLVKIVKRALINPDAIRGQSLGADGAVSITFSANSSTSQSLDGVYILDGDLADLDRALVRANAGTGGHGARSRRLVAYPESLPDMSVLPLP